jgi:FkbO/Hyg5 family chorismatase
MDSLQKFYHGDGITSLRCEFIDNSDFSELEQLFGFVEYGKEYQGPALVNGTPTLRINMAQSDSDLFGEQWFAGGECESAKGDDFCYARTSDHLFYVGEIKYSKACRKATFNEYCKALELEKQMGFKSLLRVWNFIPNINSSNGEGLEIYRDFCAGRADAFERFSESFRMPAATGIGSLGGDIAFYFIASKSDEIIYLENPSQMPAYTYPKIYGPKSPSFARATYSNKDKQILVSGTASIRGHKTLFVDDISRQCDITLHNIAILLNGSNLMRHGINGEATLKDLDHIKVYVRHREHIPLVKEKCVAVFSKKSKIKFLNVDICRSDLLVEIEAVASRINIPAQKNISSDILNPSILELGGHPFSLTSDLLKDVANNKEYSIRDLTIGEPQISPPLNIIEEQLSRIDGAWGKYPPNDGTADFRSAVTRWIESRNQIPNESIDPEGFVIPTAGAREALFQVGTILKKNSGKPYLAMPTPHYAPYRAAAIMSGLKPLYLASNSWTSYLPSLEDIEKHAPHLSALFLCTPSNPEGAIATPQYLSRVLYLARRHNFLLIVDESYSELFFNSDVPPSGIIDVCWHEHCGMKHGDPFKNVLVINSLSKRSSAAGLRIGFVCGDREVVTGFIKFRAYSGGTAALPNIQIATGLLRDESHVRDIRGYYLESLNAVDSVLKNMKGYRRPDGGMFLWLKVTDSLSAAKELWRSKSIRSVPGVFLGPPAWNGDNPGLHHLRIALVHSADILRDSAQRIAPILDEFGVR